MCVNAFSANRGFALLTEFFGSSGSRAMAFRISANLGDEKPEFRFDEAEAGTAHLEVVIDNMRIDRLHASRLLRAMADRLLECDWPPEPGCGAAVSPNKAPSLAACE
jgi:hypothetical protein